MSADIGKGDFVECIYVEPTKPEERRYGFVVGCVCQVRELVWDSSGDLCLLFADMPDPEEDWCCGWAAEAFRPIHRPSQSSLIQDLLKVREGSDANAHLSTGSGASAPSKVRA